MRVGEKTTCGCCERMGSANTRLTSMGSRTIFLVISLGLLNLPTGFSHIASIIENDGVPGMPAKPRGLGPTVPPVPSPETLDQLEQLSRGGRDDGFFNPVDALRNLLSRASSDRPHGLLRRQASQFHGNVGYGMPRTETEYRPSHSWDYNDDGTIDEEDEEKPTFVPYIGARALTNIPQFFEHLKENIEALKLTPMAHDSDEGDDGDDGDDTTEDDSLEDRRRITKPAARRMKAELLVDEDMGRSVPNSRSSFSTSDSWSHWKPRAAGTIHYYAPKSTSYEAQQSILRRANNYNPSWLYTNLGLGKRRR